MNRLSLQNKILMLALVPVILLSSVMTLYMTYSRINDLDTLYNEKVSAIARQIAADNTAVLFTRDYPSLKNNVDGYFEVYQNLVRVNIYSKDKSLSYDTQALSFDNSQVLHYSSPILLQTSSSRLEDFTDLAGQDDQPLLFSEQQLQGYVEIWLLDTLAEQQHTIIQSSIAILFVVIALTVILAIPISKRIVNPIIKLREGFENIASGDFSTRMEENATDELHTLQQGFNQMSYALARQKEELNELVDQMTSDLQTTLQTVEIQNVELDIARKQAIESSRIKSEFLAKMSHEIRTPMNAIMGYADLLRKAELKEQDRLSANIISNSAHNLLGILNDILDYSKLEAGKIVLNPEFFSLEDCIQSTCQIYAEAAFRKKIDIVPMLYNDLPAMIKTDRLRLEQILGNLLSNAIKFSEDSNIIIRIMPGDSASDRQCELKISVIDKGIGMPKMSLKYLFIPFSQLQNANKPTFKGTGLGLAISKALAEIMQGRIEVISEEGKGSQFTLKLPVEIAAEPVTHLADAWLSSPVAGKQVILFENDEESYRSHINQLNNLKIKAEHKTLSDSRDVSPADLYIVSLSAHEIERIDEHRVFLESLKARQIPMMILSSSLNEEKLNRLKELCDCLVVSRPVLGDMLLDSIMQALDLKPAEPSLLSSMENPLDQDKAPYQGKSVLVVDDNDINRHLMCVMLNDLQCHVTEAVSGQEAIAHCKKQQFDLVFMDIHMPEMNGIEATRQIRETNTNIPVFALTADIAFREQTQDSALFNDTLIKPVDAVTIQNRLTGFFSNDPLQTSPAKSISTPDMETEPHSTDSINSLYDKEQALRITGGSQQVADQLLGQLIEQLPGYITRIDEQTTGKDWEQLWQTLHKLHGAVAVCGTPALKQVINNLQKRIKNADYLRIEHGAEEVKQQAQALIAYYENKLEQG